MVAQVCVAAFVGEGEVESHGVFFSCDSTQGRQYAALLVQHNAEVPFKKKNQKTSVHFSYFCQFCSVYSLTFLAHGSAGQTDLPGGALEGESDAVERGDGGEDAGVTEEGN